MVMMVAATVSVDIVVVIFIFIVVLSVLFRLARWIFCALAFRTAYALSGQASATVSSQPDIQFCHPKLLMSHIVDHCQVKVRPG